MGSFFVLAIQPHILLKRLALPNKVGVIATRNIVLPTRQKQ